MWRGGNNAICRADQKIFEMYIPKQIAVSHFDRANRALCLELFHGSPTVLRCLSFREESIRLDSEIYRSDCHLDYDLIGLAIDFISSS